MFADVVFVCLCFVIFNGVFGVDANEVKSVLEGESVTLHTDVTDIQRYDLIEWIDESQALMAEINIRDKSSSIYDERFRDKLKLDSQTGSLTITNISITDSGCYTGKLKIIGNNTTSCRRFNVTVYAHLPVPVIISRVSSQCSSSSERSSVSKCVLLCSVMNVTHVSLSWYKGNSLLSSISVSDLNIRLSLPLEVDYQDTNTYTCVINNPITNQTQHLHINDVCQCSEHQVAVIVAVILVTVLCILLGIIAGVVHHSKRLTSLIYNRSIQKKLALGVSGR